MKNPQTSHMLALVQFINSGSLKKAALELNITQPALSMQLKRFEGQFKFPLFDYVGKKKVLTQYGKVIYDESVRLLSEIESSFENIDRTFGHPKEQVLRVGCRRELIYVSREKLKFEGAIQFFPMTSKEAIELLLAQKIDVAITREVIPSNELRAKLLISNKPCLMVHSNLTTNYGKRSLETNKQFLTNTPVILYDKKGSMLSDWLYRMDLTVNQLNVKYICDDWLTVLDFIESGVGYSIVPDSLITLNKLVKTIELPKESVPSYDYYLVQRKSSLKFPAFANLVK